MPGPLTFAVFVTMYAALLTAVIATDGNPLVVIAAVLGAAFLAGRLAGRF